MPPARRSTTRPSASTNPATYAFQLSRRVDGDWTLYGTVFPEVLGDEGVLGAVLRNGIVLLALAGLAWSRPTELAGLLRRAGVLTLLFISLQVFFSPQWVLWLSPLGSQQGKESAMRSASCSSGSSIAPI